MSTRQNPSGEKKRLVELKPSELVLDLGSPEAPSTILKVQNLTEEPLAFKIKTTNPNRYLVKPNQEVLPPQGSVDVTIQMQSQQWGELLEGEPDETQKDKFLVASARVDSSFADQVKEARKGQNKELQTVFSKFWEKTDKDELANRRIACSFLFPASATSPAKNGVQASAPAASDPVPAATVASPAKKVGETLPAPVAAAVQPSAPPAAAALNWNNNTDASKGATSKDAEMSFVELKGQYKETVQLLVSVTEERDRYQARCKDLTKELTQLKDDARSSSGKMDGGDGRMVATSGIQQWHLLLVAILSFLVARLVQISNPELMPF